MRVGLENPSERPPGTLDRFSSPPSAVRAVKAPQGDAPRLSGKEEVTGAPQPSVRPGARARVVSFLRSTITPITGVPGDAGEVIWPVAQPASP